jgi:hypothetical protein
VGSFAGTAIGTRLRLDRPLLLQFTALAITATCCLGAAVAYGFAGYGLAAAVLLAVVAATGSGLAKLSVDAVIQKSVREENRASAFAHSETLLQLAFVAGGGLGLIPLGGPWGLLLAALLLLGGAVRVGLWIWSLRSAGGRGTVAPDVA